MSRIPTLSWVEFRERNYGFQADPEDFLRWNQEQRTIILRRLLSVVVAVITGVLLVLLKPHIQDTVVPRAISVLVFGVIFAWVFLYWRNPYRWTTSGGAPGDCTVRSK